jgi:very-short-patch-repair endonuclease
MNASTTDFLSAGFMILRFSNNEVFVELDGVLNMMRRGAS